MEQKIEFPFEAEIGLPFEAGLMVRPRPITSPRVEQLINAGEIEGIRTPTGRYLVKLESVRRYNERRLGKKVA